jgi:chromosome segregation ATPase
MAEWAKQAQA